MRCGNVDQLTVSKHCVGNVKQLKFDFSKNLVYNKYIKLRNKLNIWSIGVRERQELVKADNLNNIGNKS